MEKDLIEQEFLETQCLDNYFKSNLESLIEYGVSAGADLVEIFIENIDNIGILVEQDAVTSVSPTIAKGVGIRVFLGNKDGFVSTNDLTEKGLKFALDQALGMLGLEKTSYSTYSFNGLQNLKDYGKLKNDFYKSCPSILESTSKMLEASNLLKKYGPLLSVRRGSYSKTDRKRTRLTGVHSCALPNCF